MSVSSETKSPGDRLGDYLTIHSDAIRRQGKPRFPEDVDWASVDTHVRGTVSSVNSIATEIESSTGVSRKSFNKTRGNRLGKLTKFTKHAGADDLTVERMNRATSLKGHYREAFATVRSNQEKAGTNVIGTILERIGEQLASMLKEGGEDAFEVSADGLPSPDSPRFPYCAFLLRSPLERYT